MIPVQLESLLLRIMKKAEKKLGVVEIQFSIMPTFDEISVSPQIYNRLSDRQLLKLYRQIEIFLTLKCIKNAGYAITSFGVLAESANAEDVIVHFVDQLIQNLDCYAKISNYDIDEDDLIDLVVYDDDLGKREE